LADLSSNKGNGDLIALASVKVLLLNVKMTMYYNRDG